MLHNYLTVAARNLIRNKANTAINIAGLALGIGCCLVLFLVVRYELSFDAHHTKADRIYRVNTQTLKGDGGFTANAPVPVGKALKEDFPEIEEVTSTAFLDNGGLLKVGNQLFKQPGVAYVGPEFFKLFNAVWLAGNPQQSLSEPNAVVLSETVAQKYFGKEAVSRPEKSLGKTIKLNGKYTLKVTGLIQDFPATTDLPFSVLISYKSLPAQTEDDLKSWSTVSSVHAHFVLLKPGVKPNNLEAKFPDFRRKYAPDNSQTYLLQPLREMHRDTRFSNYNQRTTSIESINALVLIGVFILLIACINFINLATAQSVKRSKEIGVRKVLGANRLHLFRQFISETFLLTFLALAVAVLGVLVVLPALQELLQAKILFEFWHDTTILAFLAAIILFVTALAGFYPALVISGFKPVLALKNNLTAARPGGLSLRRGLIVVQFVIAQVLIIGTVVVADQLDYFRSKSLGFKQDAIITLPLPANIPTASFPALRNELTQLAGVKNVSFALTPPAYEGGWFSGFNYPESGLKEAGTCQIMPIDAAYLQTYGLELVAGRNLRQNGDSVAVLVNEALLRVMHIKSPAEAIGRKITSLGQQATIVGVVKDFHAQTLKKATGPILMNRFDWAEVAGIQLTPGDLPQAIPQIKQIWQKHFPESVFEFTFLDAYIANFYREETKMYKVFRIFAGIAIFISCLGLYGLVSFMAIQRNKEIGIRKVLGASVANIVALFSKEFFALIFIAFAVAAPIAWYFMYSWLQNFEYRITLGWPIFLTAILFSLIIAGITVVYRSARAAMANPVQNLRSE